MRVKLKTPERVIVGLSRRDLIIITNCLYEASHGLIMDRFVPANKDLAKMLENVKDIIKEGQMMKVKPAIV
jgi:hypothetical protein